MNSTPTDHPLSSYQRAFVLLSGGVDSATALYMAHDHYGPGRVTAVSFNYGQKHKKEIEHAKILAGKIQAEHEVIQLPGLSGFGVMLTDKDTPVVKGSYADIKGISPTYVPYRNGTMLSHLAAHSMKYVKKVQEMEGLDADSPLLKDLCNIYFGAHAEDAFNWAYPDCTPEFIGAMANAIHVGTYRTTRLTAPFVHSSKAQIVLAGSVLNVPYEHTWSCYAGGDLHCGECPTCLARKGAFKAAGIQDPTVYATDVKKGEELDTGIEH